MGKYKGKPKAVKAEPVKSRNDEFSEDSDAEFSDENGDFDEEDAEYEEMMSPAEDDEEEEDGEEEEDEEEGGLTWGTKRSDFYKRESSSEGEDEEEGEDNDEEAMRLLKKRQSKLKQEDLELGGDEDDDEEDVSAPVVVRKSSKSRSAAENDDEALASEAPEVLALLSEFSTKASEIKEALLPVLERLRKEEESSTKEGVAYLETKTHLLLSYTLNVAFYLLYRAENGAAKAESHPVVTQLVRLRTLLEKLRPLDLKLKNELDELVRRALVGKTESGEEEAEDSQNEEAKLPKTKKGGFRPDLNDLENDGADLGSVGELDEADEASYEDYEDAKEKRKLERQKKHQLNRAERSQFLKELREEQSDAPQEVVDDLRAASKDSKYAMAKRKYEEENFVRVRENKKTRAKEAQREKRAAIHGGDLNTLLAEADENEYSKFKDLLDEDGGQNMFAASRDNDAGGSGDEDDFDDEDEARKRKPVALAKHLNEMSQARKASKNQFKGGDDDVLPSKKQRRTEIVQDNKEIEDDSRMSRQAFKEEDIDVDEDEEHPFYKEASKRRKQASKEKAESYKFPQRPAPEPVRMVESGQSRLASREMIKNRGLTPHRNKDKKNPRRNMRLKYEDKVKARRGQVRDVRTGEGDYYQGEQTGIRSNVVRSRQAGKF